MSILFLDPLVLSAYALLGLGVWSIWTGAFRSWFGHDASWTLWCWPFPLVTGILPVVAGILAGLAGLVGIGTDQGGTLAGAAYLGAYVVPWVLLSLYPPRWLLPPWARARLARLPSRREAPPGTVPALHAWRGRGHASRGRWVWAVDALPGHLRVDGDGLQFRAEGLGDDDASESHRLLHERDDDLISRLEFHDGEGLRLQPPRGGWWTRGSLDVDLGVVERWGCSWTRRGSRAGLLTLKVDGRPELRLWVSDTRAVEAAISGWRGPTARA